MLSEQDKKDMLADALSASRRDHFRAARKAQEDRPVSGAAYLDFLTDMKKIFPEDPSGHKGPVGNDFRL